MKQLALILALLCACLALTALSFDAPRSASCSTARANLTVQLSGISGELASPTPLAGVLTTGETLECRIITATPSPTATVTLTPTITNTPHGNPLFVTATKIAQGTPIPLTPQPSITPTLPTVTMTVNASPYLNLRQCAGTGCAILRTLANGTQVQATLHREQVAGTWWRLISVDGQAGWVAEVYLEAK